MRYIPMVKCESCLKPYAETEMVRVPEDDEGGYWNLCEPCWDAIQDTADLMEG